MKQKKTFNKKLKTKERGINSNAKEATYEYWIWIG